MSRCWRFSGFRNTMMVTLALPSCKITSWESEVFYGEEPQNEGCQGWERRKVTCIRDGTDATVGTEDGPGPVSHAMG